MRSLTDEFGHRNDLEVNHQQERIAVRLDYGTVDHGLFQPVGGEQVGFDMGHFLGEGSPKFVGQDQFLNVIFGVTL